jgi:hypothetical protein
LNSANANRPIGGLRGAIQENGVPRSGLVSFGARFAVELSVKNAMRRNDGTLRHKNGAR